MDVLAIQEDPVFIVINGQLPGLEDAGLGQTVVFQPGTGVTDGGPDAGQQLRRAEGLRDIVIRAGVQGLDLVALVGAGGDCLLYTSRCV